MPRGIDVPQRVIQAIAIPVKELGVASDLHHRIRAEEAAQGRVVEAGAVVVEAQRALLALAGETPGRGRVLRAAGAYYTA